MTRSWTHQGHQCLRPIGMAGPPWVRLREQDLPLFEVNTLAVCADTTNQPYSLLPGGCSLKLLPYRVTLLRSASLPHHSAVYYTWSKFLGCCCISIPGTGPLSGSFSVGPAVIHAMSPQSGQSQSSTGCGRLWPGSVRRNPCFCYVGFGYGICHSNRMRN